MANTNKPFHGRAIYQPSGAAGEYSQWACNLFNGCPNRCDYCYNRHSMTAKVLGADEVTMKKQLQDKEPFNSIPAWKIIFMREFNQNYTAIRHAGGLFLSFVSDPMLPETVVKTRFIFRKCACNNIPVTILTKSAWWVSGEASNKAGHSSLLAENTRNDLLSYRSHLSLGFTLTGMHEMERHCISTTQERINAMQWAQEQGIYTWASIEPVIHYEKALGAIFASLPFCKEYRIGLASKLGIKYDPADVLLFKKCVETTVGDRAKIVWKKSVLDKIN